MLEIIVPNQKQASESVQEENRWHLNIQTIENLVAFTKQNLLNS